LGGVKGLILVLLTQKKKKVGRDNINPKVCVEKITLGAKHDPARLAIFGVTFVAKFDP